MVNPDASSWSSETKCYRLTGRRRVSRLGLSLTVNLLKSCSHSWNLQFRQPQVSSVAGPRNQFQRKHRSFKRCGVFLYSGQGPICHEVNLERSVFRSDGGRPSSIGERGALIQIIAWRPRGIHFLEKCCIPQPGCRADEASAMRRSFT